MSYQDFISHAAPYEVVDGTFPPANSDSPLAARLAQCEAEGRAALIGYLPVGFPTLEESIDAAIALTRAAGSSSPLTFARTASASLVFPTDTR